MKTLLIVAGVAAVGGIGWYIWKNKKASATAPPRAPIKVPIIPGSGVVHTEVQHQSTFIGPVTNRIFKIAVKQS